MLSRRAFSLVEVVLAIGIVSFAFLILLALVPIGLKSEKTSASETSAVNLMHSIMADLSSTPLISAGSTTNNIYSMRFGLSPLPVAVSTPTTTTNYLTESQQITTAAAAQYRVVMNYSPAITTSGSYTAPSVLIQIFWPAAATTNNAQGVYESYATFLPYKL